MRGLKFLGDRRAEVVDFPEVEPGPDQVLIRMRASGICGSDLPQYRAQYDPASPGKRPGHEPCGEIAAVGSLVTGVSVGDRVMQHHYEGCKRCSYCRSGWQQLCPVQEGRLYYGRSAHGGHGDFMVAHQSTLVALPAPLTFEEGAFLACGAATAYTALKRLDLSGRDTLAVFGQGPVGLAVTMFAVEMGARVIAVDVDPARLEMSEAAGAYKTIDDRSGTALERIRALTAGRGADATLEAVGSHSTRVAAVEATRVFGRTCLVGEGGDVTFNVTPHITHRQLTLIGSWTFSTFGLEEAANFVAERGVQLNSLISSRSSIEDAPMAYADFDAGAPGKFVIAW
jgi:threonine dehydrogenase-like Zn-dependent dehydrogenase